MTTATTASGTRRRPVGGAPAGRKPRTAAVPSEPMYERVASRLGRLIAAGTFRPGDRLPSVRRLARDQNVSVTTAIEAFRRLEDRGIVETRPQSGTYVREAARPDSPEPAMSPAGELAASPELGRRAVELIHEMGRPDLVPFGAAVPNPILLPAARLSRSLSRMVRLHTGEAQAYCPLPGNPRLRKEIARRLLGAGCEISPDEILVTAGAQEALELALRATTKPGDVVAVESPTYHGLLQAIEALHLRAFELATYPRDGICLDALGETLAKERIAAVALVATNGNPLGHSMPEAKRKKLVALLAKAKIPLIEDDTYGELSFAPHRPPALLGFDRAGGVLHCGSFSKTLAPGYRVGWIVGGRFRKTVEWLKFGTSVATSSPAQLAIADHLASGGYERDLRRIRRGYAELVDRMSRAIAESFPESTAMTRPAGGQVLWVEIPGVDSFELQRKALAAGISVAPGPIFSASGRYRDFVRINCAIPWSGRIEQAVATLGSLAKEELASGRRIRSR